MFKFLSGVAVALALVAGGYVDQKMVQAAAQQVGEAARPVVADVAQQVADSAKQ